MAFLPPVKQKIMGYEPENAPARIIMVMIKGHKSLNPNEIAGFPVPVANSLKIAGIARRATDSDISPDQVPADVQASKNEIKTHDIDGPNYDPAIYKQLRDQCYEKIGIDDTKKALAFYELKGNLSKQKLAFGTEFLQGVAKDGISVDYQSAPWHDEDMQDVMADEWLGIFAHLFLPESD